MFTRLIVRLLSEMAGVFGSVSFDATTLLLMNELGHGCGLKIIFGLNIVQKDSSNMEPGLQK